MILNIIIAENIVKISVLPKKLQFLQKKPIITLIFETIATFYSVNNIDPRQQNLLIDQDFEL
jgi:hypothetical protein